MKKKWLLLIILLVIIIFLGGGFLVWKYAFKKEKPLNQLSDEELKKCLLEDFSRRLELRKRENEENYTNINECKITSELSRDLTKLTASYTKKLEEKG